MHWGKQTGRGLEIGGVAFAIGLASVMGFIMCIPAYAVEKSLPVLKRAVQPGDTVTQDIIAEKAFSSNHPSSQLVETAEALTGKTAKRTLLPGEPIPKSAVRDPYVILQGKPVMLIAQSGGLTITGAAVSMEQGSVGDVITARNAASGVIVKGIVMADGSLRVDVP